jgi:hypothetical protein
MSSFALALGEVHQIQLVQLDEVVDRCDAHLRHRGINVEEAEERCRPTQVLQARLVDIAVHPVDRLDLGRDGQGHRPRCAVTSSQAPSWARRAWVNKPLQAVQLTGPTSATVI